MTQALTFDAALTLATRAMTGNILEDVEAAYSALESHIGTGTPFDKDRAVALGESYLCATIEGDIVCWGPDFRRRLPEWKIGREIHIIRASQGV